MLCNGKLILDGTLAPEFSPNFLLTNFHFIETLSKRLPFSDYCLMNTCTLLLTNKHYCDCLSIFQEFGRVIRIVSQLKSRRYLFSRKSASRTLVPNRVKDTEKVTEN